MDIMRFSILVLLVALASPISADPLICSTDPPPLPGSDFNATVLEVLQSYPTDGTHQYYWPTSGGWLGNTRDLYYLDQLYAAGDSLQRCYCCGLTFEVFLRAYQAYCQAHQWPFIIADFDLVKLDQFRRQWFGCDGNRRTLQNAVVSHALGQAITDLEEACAGDFVQFWRYSGSGHSVVFIRWERDEEDNIIGLHYWSTQGSTNGIGYRTEYFQGPYGIDSDQIYIARVGQSPEEAK